MQLRSLVLISLACCLCAWNDTYTATAAAPLLLTVVGQAPQDQPLSPDALDDLVAPIALYPDPLLAQIFPAATFSDQVQAAAQLVQARGVDEAAIESQDWDVSVMALAHYPAVLQMLADLPDWATELGQAYVEQPDDVMAAVQRLRAEAAASGALVTNSYEDVERQGDQILIWPAQPGLIYVPQYDPAVVYIGGPGAAGFLTFGVGFPIGAWLNSDFDWTHHHIFHHGWTGGGWIGRSRSHIQLNKVYNRPEWVNRPVAVNHAVINRSVNRANVPNYHQPSAKGGGNRALATSRPPANRVRAAAGTAPGRVSALAPGQPRPLEQYRGHDNPNLRLPAEPTPFGVDHTPAQVQTERSRGVQSLRGVPGNPGPRAAPAPRQAPAPQSAPAPRGNSGGGGGNRRR